MELYKTLDDTLTVPKRTVGYSKEYLLAEIDDLADEFSGIDENGLHSERWCGIMDVKQIIINAPSVSDRPQGKWIHTAGEYIGDDVSGFYDYHWACSECEKEAIINDWNIYELSDYCPHCGAKMKGADDE